MNKGMIAIALLVVSAHASAFVKLPNNGLDASLPSLKGKSIGAKNLCGNFASTARYALRQRYQGKTKWQQRKEAKKQAQKDGHTKTNKRMFYYLIDMAYHGPIPETNAQYNANLKHAYRMFHRRCMNHYGAHIKPCRPSGYRHLNENAYRDCDQ